MFEHDSRPTRRTVLEGLVGLAGTASLAGCTGAVPSAGEGSSIRYAQVLPPVTLDPIDAGDVWSAQAIDRVFDGLYTFGSGTNVVPQLAAGMPKQTDDGTAYTVDLRTDATFHDGSPVTPDDARYTFEELGATDAPFQWAVDPVESVRAPDEHTVEFRLEHPYPSFLYALTHPVVPREARESSDAFGTNPVGSGPYEARSVDEGSHAVLDARDDGWRGTRPSVDSITFVGEHSGLARSMSMRSEQNDLVERVQPRLWSVTDEMPGTSVRRSPGLHYCYVGFNCNAGPTANPTVRTAIDHLVDMDELVSHFVDPGSGGDDGGDATGLEWRQYGPVPNALAEEWSLPVDEWESVPKGKDPEAAKRLLDEAGIDSWTPKVAVPKDMLREKFADALVHELANVGFDRARTVKYDWPTFREKLAAGSPSDYDLFVGSWAGWSDPDTFLYPLFHENNEGVTNFTFYRRESVMNRIRRARETTDRNERARLYERAIATLLEDRVHLPAFTMHNTFGVDSALDGFEPHRMSAVNPRLVGPDGNSSLSKHD